MVSVRTIVRQTFTRLIAPYLFIGSICLLVVFAPPPVHAEAGTLDLKASTASYSGTMTQAGNQPIRTAFGPLRLDYKSGPNNWTTGFLMREGDGNISIGANITSADFYSTSKLRVLGIVESTNGGFKFPDGTTQTSAASGNVSGWTDGGTNVYTTTTTDNVGIGTTAPGWKLHVVGGDAYFDGGQTAIRLRNDGATQYRSDFSMNQATGLQINAYDDGGGAYIPIQFDGLVFRVYSGTSGNTLGLYQDTTGNVGIGSTAPGAKFEVVGNINSSTGAIQTAGVTRIANDGVGTFAAGTTIGGGGIPGGAGINSVQTFAATGTWTKPAGVTKVLVEVQGGGGGGGGAAGDASYGRSGYYGGKGAAGGFCRKLIDVSAVSTVAVTIGAGGTGGNRGYGANNDDTSGTAGGASSFGNYCTGNGGGGGIRGQYAGESTGGTSTGGDVNVTGEAGSPGYPSWYGRFLGRGMNGAGHGGNGGECCGNPYALGNNGYVGTAGNVVVWEYK